MALFKQPLQITPSLPKSAFIIIAALCLLSFITAPVALGLGFSLTVLMGNPFEKQTAKLTPFLLQCSIVGIGFGMNIHTALEVGKTGLLFTICSITAVLFLGTLLTRVLKVDGIIGYLISVGTAICGGSAIAATSPIIKAKTQQTSISLAVIFVLNALALMIFPPIGRWLHLTQDQFGLWCAVAIHDTSAVVGASSKYGDRALEIATTVKLARALWIIPISLLSTRFFKTETAKLKMPYFIFLFLLALLMNSYFSFAGSFHQMINTSSKSGLNLTLFFIGAGLSWDSIKNIGFKPFFLAVVLWICISFSTLFLIMN